MIGPTQRLCEAEKSVSIPLDHLDLSQVRADFAELMDDCANTVTMDHGLDLDDVIMERFAKVVIMGETNAIDIPIPFLADSEGIVRSIQAGSLAACRGDIAPDRIMIVALLVVVFMETAPPLFNQAANAAVKPKNRPDRRLD